MKTVLKRNGNTTELTSLLVWLHNFNESMFSDRFQLYRIQTARQIPVYGPRQLLIL